MEDSKKKPIMIGIVVVCLVLAVVITLAMRLGGSGSDLSSLKRGEMIWVMCLNPQCKAEYEMDKKDYYEFLQNYSGPRTEGAPPVLVCKECKKESVVKAVKCKKCGVVFREGAIPNDFADRCPQCKYSDVEEMRK